MKELNEEIKLTLNLMQTDIDDGAHSELQFHLYSLLEMKRDMLQRSWVDDQSPYKSGPIIGRANPLTTEERGAAAQWMMREILQECSLVLKVKNKSTA